MYEEYIQYIFDIMSINMDYRSIILFRRYPDTYTIDIIYFNV